MHPFLVLDVHVVTQVNEGKNVNDVVHHLLLSAILIQDLGHCAVPVGRNRDQEFRSFQARLRKCLIRSTSLPHEGSTTDHEAIFARS